jgi:hypothetical protein
MNNNNDTALFAIPAIPLLLLLLLSFSSPSVTMAQQITTTTIPPLTPEEQEEQNRLQNVIAATNQNLDETEKEVNGIVYTPRWSNPVWVEANSLSILFAYCLPGEFAQSGQEILGGFELEVLESYEIALPQGFMAWMMVIGNEDRQDRLPAAVGVICASDLNDVETRVLSPDEQQQINNVVQQFTTQVTNIEQVINIINNVTTNGTGTTTPPPPPPPPMGNGTGNGTGGGGAGGIPENATAEADRTPPVVDMHTLPRQTTTLEQGGVVRYAVKACDNVDGAALLDERNILYQQDEFIEGLCGYPIQDANIGGDITISCNPPSGSIFPVGVTSIRCTAVDVSGNTGTASHTITVRGVPPPTEGALVEEEQPPAAEEEEPPAAEEEEPPAAEEEAPATEEPEAPATEEDEGAAASPPANEAGGGG